MTLPTQRPLLGELDAPVRAAAWSAEEENVLKDSSFLVERFFDQQRIVCNLERTRPSILRLEGRHRAQQNHADDKKPQHAPLLCLNICAKCRVASSSITGRNGVRWIFRLEGSAPKNLPVFA